MSNFCKVPSHIVNIVLRVILSTQPAYCNSTIKTTGVRKTGLNLGPIYWGNSYQSSIFKTSTLGLEGFLLLLLVPYLSRSLSHSQENVLTGFLRVGRSAIRLFAREKRILGLFLKWKLPCIMERYLSHYQCHLQSDYWADCEYFRREMTLEFKGLVGSLKRKNKAKQTKMHIWNSPSISYREFNGLVCFLSVFYA